MSARSIQIVHGGRVERVDPKNTTKMCSNCKTIVPKRLNIRTHSCPVCGLILPRDYNAAINILSSGTELFERRSIEALSF